MSVLMVFFFKFVNMGKAKRNVAITWGLTFLRRDIWNERKANFFQALDDVGVVTTNSPAQMGRCMVRAWSEYYN